MSKITDDILSALKQLTDQEEITYGQVYADFEVHIEELIENEVQKRVQKPWRNELSEIVGKQQGIQQGRQEANMVYLERIAPALKALSDFQVTIDWINGFMSGFKTQGKINVAQAALDGMVGAVGGTRDELLQKSLAAWQLETVKGLIEEIRTIAGEYQVSLNAFLNDANIDGLTTLADRSNSYSVLEAIRAQMEALAAEGKLGGVDSDPELAALDAAILKHCQSTTLSVEKKIEVYTKHLDTRAKLSTQESNWLTNLKSSPAATSQRIRRRLKKNPRWPLDIS